MWHMEMTFHAASGECSYADLMPVNAITEHAPISSIIAMIAVYCHKDVHIGI